jgi:MFS family permease
MSAGGLYFTSEMALLPQLLKDEKSLKISNEIHSIIWSLSFTFGITIGGILIYLFGTTISFMIDSLMFIFAFLIFKTIDFKIDTKKDTSSFIKMSLDTFDYLKNNKQLIYLIILHSSVGLTAFDSLVAFLADNEYKYIISIPLAIGYTNGIRGLALAIGPMIINRFIPKNISLMLIFQGLSIVIWAFLQYNFYLGLFGMFLVGLWTTSIWSITYAMIQAQCDKKYLGRVISYNDMFFMLSNIATISIVGVLVWLGVSLFATTTLLGIIFFLFAILYHKIKLPIT